MLLDDEGVVLVALCLVAIGTQVCHAQRVHHLDGAFQSTRVGVDAVVVAGGEYVEARIDARLQVFVGCAELRVALIWRAAECHFKVGYGQVGAFYLGLHQVEHAAVVVFAAGAQCVLYLWGVLHEVAGEE